VAADPEADGSRRVLRAKLGRYSPDEAYLAQSYAASAAALEHCTGGTMRTWVGEAAPVLSADVPRLRQSPLSVQDELLACWHERVKEVAEEEDEVFHDDDDDKDEL
jgi:hypothetical protein